jgi:hypothetical protein
VGLRSITWAERPFTSPGIIVLITTIVIIVIAIIIIGL